MREADVILISDSMKVSSTDVEINCYFLPEFLFIFSRNLAGVGNDGHLFIDLVIIDLSTTSTTEEKVDL